MGSQEGVRREGTALWHRHVATGVLRRTSRTSPVHPGEEATVGEGWDESDSTDGSGGGNVYTGNG